MFEHFLGISQTILVSCSEGPVLTAQHAAKHCMKPLAQAQIKPGSEEPEAVRMCYGSQPLPIPCVSAMPLLPTVL